MRLDKARLGQTLLKGAQRWIEPLHVTYLQNNSPFFGEFHQFQRLLGRLGNRFLDQKMFSLSEQEFSNFVVICSRRRDGRCIDQICELFEVCSNRNTLFLRSRFGSLSVYIKDSSELNPGKS